MIIGSHGGMPHTFETHTKDFHNIFSFFGTQTHLTCIILVTGQNICMIITSTVEPC